MIRNPGSLPDHSQNWITGSLCHAGHTLKISERSVHNFSSYLAHTQTNRQTQSDKNITSLAEVTIGLFSASSPTSAYCVHLLRGVFLCTRQMSLDPRCDCFQAPWPVRTLPMLMTALARVSGRQPNVIHGQRTAYPCQRWSNKIMHIYAAPVVVPCVCVCVCVCHRATACVLSYHVIYWYAYAQSPFCVGLQKLVNGKIGLCGLLIYTRLHVCLKDFSSMAWDFLVLVSV